MLVPSNCSSFLIIIPTRDIFGVAIEHQNQVILA